MYGIFNIASSAVPRILVKPRTRWSSRLHYFRKPRERDLYTVIRALVRASQANVFRSRAVHFLRSALYGSSDPHGTDLDLKCWF
jgi:hypothetical protein